MWTNKISINDQLGLGLNNNNLSKYKNIYESRLLKPEIKTRQNLVNQAPIRRFQKSYYKNRSLASNQKILNQIKIVLTIIIFNREKKMILLGFYKALIIEKILNIMKLI